MGAEENGVKHLKETWNVCWFYRNVLMLSQTTAEISVANLTAQ